MSVSSFWAAVVIATFVRVAALPLPGAEDTSVWKLWTFATPTDAPPAAYWANPATILNGEVLGYLDPLMALPARVYEDVKRLRVVADPP